MSEFNPLAVVGLTTNEQRLRPEKSGAFRLWCDNTKIDRLTGFKPQVGLREGLQRITDWMIKPQSLRLYRTYLYSL